MKETTLAKKIAKIIRICTIAPVSALIMLVVLYFKVPGFYLSTAHFVLALVCLCVLPVSAYPFSHLLRCPPEQFREKQRKLAIVFSLVGYITLLVVAFTAGYTHGEMAIYLDYVISVVVIALTSRFPKYKASGHACGVAGPAAILVYFVSPWFWLLLGVLAAVFWSSIVLGRHTLPQLISGTLTSSLIVVVLSLIGFI